MLGQAFFDREHDPFRQHELGRRRCQPRDQERRGRSFKASPSYAGGVLVTAHDTEGHQPPAKDHRQRPEDPRRREAAGVR